MWGEGECGGVAEIGLGVEGGGGVGPPALLGKCLT